MDYFKLIETRESCRKYMNTPVKRAAIDRCIEAARIAPSACNSQPWRYVVVDNPQLVKKLWPLMQLPGSPINAFADQVPVYVIVIEKPIDLTEKLGAACLRKNFSELDIGISVAHFCLAATEQGLGNCILGTFQEAPIKELLGIPEGYIIRLAIALGHAAPGEPRPKKRIDTEALAAYNAFTDAMK